MTTVAGTQDRGASPASRRAIPFPRRWTGSIASWKSAAFHRVCADRLQCRCGAGGSHDAAGQVLLSSGNPKGPERR